MLLILRKSTLSTCPIFGQSILHIIYINNNIRNKRNNEEHFLIISSVINLILLNIVPKQIRINSLDPLKHRKTFIRKKENGPNCTVSGLFNTA